MKIRSRLACLLFATLSGVASAQGGYYAGVAAAWSKPEIPVDSVLASLGPQWQGAPTQVDDKGEGLKVYGGYEWRWLALEAGYTDFGRTSTYSTRGTSTSLDTVSVQWEGYAIEASALGIWRIGSVFSLFGRGGGAWRDVTRKQVTNGTHGYSSRESSRDGFSPLAGVGAMLRFAERGTLRVEYQQYFSIEDPVSGEKSDTSVLSIGAHYHF
jgi:hypothetical protein